MDNLHARMGAPAHDEPKNVSQEAPRYISPHPPVAVSEQKKNKDKKPRPKWLVVLVVVSVIAAVSLGVAKMVLNGGMDGINRDRYQAVFLADDSAGVSVYFGKLERLPDGYYKLSNVFFLPADQTADKISQDKTAQLARMADQIHSPQDMLILPREQIAYYQNMDESSTFAQYIKQNSQKN